MQQKTKHTKIKSKHAKKEQTIIGQKQLKTTLQDALGQLLKYGVASSGLTPGILCACTRSRCAAPARSPALGHARPRSGTLGS